MCQGVFYRIILIVLLLTFTGQVGCVSTDNGTNLGDSSKQRYGWWTGSRGKRVGIDIATSGSGLQIEVVRGYLAHSKIDSPVGVRWIHNYLMHLGSAPNKRLKLFRADGTTLIFTQTNPGSLISESDDTLLLTQKGNGTHGLQDRTGKIFMFNRKGRLTHIHGHEYGNILSLAYGADGFGQTDVLYLDYTGGFDLSDAFFLGINAAYANSNDADAGYQGVALYLQNTFSDTFSLGFRPEFFTTTSGAGDANQSAYTLTANKSLTSSLNFIAEVRYDTSSDVNFFGKDNVTGATIAAVYSF